MIAFVSSASDLVPGDADEESEFYKDTDVFVHHRATGETERVNLASPNQEFQPGTSPDISADGRYVAMLEATRSASNDPDPGITVRDLATDTTERVDVTHTGARPNGGSGGQPAISGEGRYVAYVSSASNLTPNDTNGYEDAFVFDRQTGTTERLVPAGIEPNGFVIDIDISSDGRYVAFQSTATNLVGGDTNGAVDVFVFDRQTRSIERVSISTSGAEANGPVASAGVSLSASGSLVAFDSAATNLDPADDEPDRDVYVRDLASDRTELASLSSEGTGGVGGHSVEPSLSDDGRFVAFHSSDNLGRVDHSGQDEIFVRDRQLGRTYQATATRPGFDQASAQGSAEPSLSGDGRFVAFASDSDLLAEDTNRLSDVYVHECCSEPSSDVPECDGRPATILGADVSGTVRGTAEADVIVGDSSREKIVGGQGNDRICGGAGRDEIAGGGGNDRLFGGAANDVLSGGGGSDRCLGQQGRNDLASNSCERT